jgi:hypothetical protein
MCIPSEMCALSFLALNWWQLHHEGGGGVNGQERGSGSVEDKESDEGAVV